MGAWMQLPVQQQQVAIAGRVLEAGTKQTIAGAEIKIEQSPRQFQAVLKKALTPKTQVCDRVTSTIEGWFYFADLPKGSYTLSISLPDAGTRYGRITTAPIVVSRAAGKLKTAIVEVLLPVTAIAGRITHKDQPVSLARIQVEGIADSTFSDADGNYLMTGLEVWQTDSPTVRPIVTVFARGHPPKTAGVQLQQGIPTVLNFELP